MCQIEKLSYLGCVLLMALLAPNVFAESGSHGTVMNSDDLNLEMERAIVNIIAARRGIDQQDVQPDMLIRTAEDIREVLQLSCELSGACLDSNGESIFDSRPVDIPAFDVAEGRRNALIILNLKEN